MKKIKQAEHLTDDQYKMFFDTYLRHYKTIGTKYKEQYGLQKISKIKVNFIEECIEVYYKNNEWFKYFSNGTWC